MAIVCLIHLEHISDDPFSMVVFDTGPGLKFSCYFAHMCIIYTRQHGEMPMPRPQKKRSVYQPPVYSGFKPTGIRTQFLDGLELTLDEFEAIRLADFHGKDHNDSATEMGISRSTFSRLVEQARHKVARFLIEGKLLQIDGGEVHFERNLIRCNACGNLLDTSIEADTTRCPDCGSNNLTDLAGGFGHGRCCRRHRNRRR